MKNILKFKLSTVLVVAFALLLSSCLKDNKYYVDFSDYEPNIELPLAAAKVNLPFVALFENVDTPTTYYAVVNVASMDKPKQPVTATLALDVEYLNQYNSEQEAAVKAAQADYLEKDPENTVEDEDYPADYEPYELLPANTYSVASWDVTVKAGEREGWVPIMISSSKIDLSKKYILPITIKEASIKISNWNHLMINVSAKNEWDGRYLYTAKTSLRNATNECCATFETIGPFKVLTNLVNYYSNEVVLTIDTATNKVTVSMETLTPIATDPSSRWDPETKTFHLKWTSNNGARKYEETYVKQE